MSRADATAAERYARAIFELGLESGDVNALARKFEAFAAVYQRTAELRNVLENPQVTSSERDAILRDVAGRLGFGTLELNAIRYIARRRRLRAVPEIAEGLSRLADERSEKRGQDAHATVVRQQVICFTSTTDPETPSAGSICRCRRGSWVG